MIVNLKQKPGGIGMNIKLSKFDRIAIQIKRLLGWKIREIAERYNVTTRTIYRVLRK
jgi:transposase